MPRVDSLPPLAFWSRFRQRLVWAYDLPLRSGEMPFIPYPSAAWKIRTGSLTVHYADGESLRCEPGFWYFPKEAEGWQECSGGLEIVSIRFQAEWAHGRPVFDRSRTIRLEATSRPGLNRAAGRLVRQIRNHHPEVTPHSRTFRADFGGYLRLQPLFFQWLAEWHAALKMAGAAEHPPEPEDPRVRQILTLLETLPLDHPVREPELARAAGCSVSQLNKCFLQQTGSSPIRIWNRRRLNAARAELLHGTQSVKALAYRLGFSSPEHFTHWFGKQTGRSPTRFREAGKAPV